MNVRIDIELLLDLLNVIQLETLSIGNGHNLQLLVQTK